MRARWLLVLVPHVALAFDREPVVGVVAHVAQASDGTDVVTRDWARAQLRTAEEFYAPLGLHFRLVEWRALPSRQASVVTRADRNAFSSACAPASINVMFVASLRDVDVTEEAYRMGVTWIGNAREYIIVSSAARPSTLTHELGHFFGLHHSKVTNNLMSYDRDGGTLFLDAAQQKTVIDTARAMIATKNLSLESWAHAKCGPLQE